MTRRLSLMLAIAILLLVNSTMGEGGALDNIASNDQPQLAEVDDAPEAATDSEGSRLAVSSSPWARSNTGSGDTGPAPVIADWGDESPAETQGVSPPATGASPMRRSAPRASSRSATSEPEGALERHRQNIEELPPHTSA